MISKENYEAYLLDYIEGNLSQKDTDMLLLFLEENPYLKDILSEYNEITLSATSTNFDKKPLLQVDLESDVITSSNLEEFAIADLENELSNSKAEELSSFIAKNTSLKKEVDLVNKTTLIANESIVYKEKEDLKKTIPLFIPYYRIAGVAAVLLLMIYFFIPNNQPLNSDSQLAVTNEQSSIISSTSENDHSTNNEISESKNVKQKKEITSDEEPSTLNSFVSVNEKSIENNETDNLSLKSIDEIKQMNYHSINKLTQIKSERVLASAMSVLQVDDYYEKFADNSSIDNNKYLSPKEFLTSIFKKNVLKTESEGTEIEVEDFNNTLASVTNDKISFKKRENNTRLLSIQTKNFSFEKKLGN